MSMFRNSLKSNLLYKVLLIITMLMMTIPYLNAYLSQFIRIFLLWGGGYILYDFVTGRRLFKGRSLLLLLGFCIAYALTIFWNREWYYVDNMKALAYMILVFILFYGHNPNTPEAEVKREIRILSHVFVTGTFFLSLVCFLTFLLSIKHAYVVRDTIGYLGMWDNRLWGLYNANTGGALNVISIFLTGSFLLMGLRKKLAVRVFYIINLVLQFCCLVLTYSRTSCYSMMIAFAVGIYFLLPYLRPALVSMKRGKAALVRLAAAGVVLVSIFLLNDIVRIGLSYLPSLTQNLIHIGESDYEFELTQEMLDRIEGIEQREGGLLTGRPILWKAGWKTFQSSPVLGVTRLGLYEQTVGYLSDPDWSPDLKAGGVHNGYLTILISSGLGGSIFLLAFWGMTGRKLLQAVRRAQGKHTVPLLLGGIFLLMFFIMEALEARILYQMNIFMVIFWMYYGYTMYFAERECDAEMD